MMVNHLLLGKSCFIVKARSLPNGVNQRPGMTLLIADEQPLELEIDGLPTLSANALLLAPNVRRRFVRTQAHTSITIEPAHRFYTCLLQWVRINARGVQQFDIDTERRIALDAIAEQRSFDLWLERLLEHHQQRTRMSSPRLDFLLAQVDAATTDATAEQIWQKFRVRYPGSQAHCSHWLQDCLGIPLRKLLLWRKLRRAMELLSDARAATDVAHAAGFADSAHLSRICLRTFGLRPSQANDHKILQASCL